MGPNGERFQFVWWGWRRLFQGPLYCRECGEWTGYWRFRWPVFRVGPMPQGGEHRGFIYRWRLALGPVEIRRWGP